MSERMGSLQMSRGQRCQRPGGQFRILKSLKRNRANHTAAYPDASRRNARFRVIIVRAAKIGFGGLLFEILTVGTSYVDCSAGGVEQANRPQAEAAAETF